MVITQLQKKMKNSFMVVFYYMVDKTSKKIIKEIYKNLQNFGVLVHENTDSHVLENGKWNDDSDKCFFDYKYEIHRTQNGFLYLILIGTPSGNKSLTDIDEALMYGSIKKDYPIKETTSMEILSMGFEGKGSLVSYNDNLYFNESKVNKKNIYQSIFDKKGNKYIESAVRYLTDSIKNELFIGENNHY